jgi:hypothetical protein
MKINLTRIKQADLKIIRKKQWLKQNKKCPILDQEILFEHSVLDHKHIIKKEIKRELGKDGKGLLRGVLDFRANAWEGKIVNSFKRVGLQKLGVYLPDALRRLAEYLENPPMEGQMIVHPGANEKLGKLGKREYNLVIKYFSEIYPKRKKIPTWKKGMKLTKEWEKMINAVNVYREKQ